MKQVQGFPPELRDINRFKDVRTLIQTVDGYADLIPKQQRERELSQEGQREIYTSGRFTITEITTSEAAADLCRETTWCVKDPSFATQYLPRGPLYMFDSGGDPFLLVHPSSGQVADDQDQPLGASMWAELDMTRIIKDLEQSSSSKVPSVVNALKQVALDWTVLEKHMALGDGVPFNDLFQYGDELDFLYGLVFHSNTALSPEEERDEIEAWEPRLLPKILGSTDYAYIMKYYRAKLDISIDDVYPRWPALESAILQEQNAEMALEYATEVLHGRWPQAEHFINKDPESYLIYTQRFGRLVPLYTEPFAPENVTEPISTPEEETDIVQDQTENVQPHLTLDTDAWKTVGWLREANKPVPVPPELEDKVFHYSISYSMTTPESAETGENSEIGIEDEGEETLRQIVQFANYKGIGPRARNDGTSWWESDYGVESYSTGEKVQYSLHIQNLSDLEFSIVNQMLGGPPTHGPQSLDQVRSVEPDKEFDKLIMLRDVGAITPDQFQEKSRQLFSWLKSAVETNKPTPGGLSLGMTAEDIATKHGVKLGHIEDQLKMGIEVEYEHTNDIEIAKKISLDHLFEDPDYYTKLEKMVRSSLITISDSAFVGRVGDSPEEERKERAWYIDGYATDEDSVCPNCQQWQRSTDSGHIDCTNECAKRGFAPKETNQKIDKPMWRLDWDNYTAVVSPSKTGYGWHLMRQNEAGKWDMVRDGRREISDAERSKDRAFVELWMYVASPEGVKTFSPNEEQAKRDELLDEALGFPEGSPEREQVLERLRAFGSINARADDYMPTGDVDALPEATRTKDYADPKALTTVAPDPEEALLDTPETPTKH